MKGELKHIFDESVCLSSRQLKDYVSGQMSTEECHAVEHHLNSCPLCSAAIDGMLLEPEKALGTLGGMNTDFLKEHFILRNPQAQLNSAVPDAEVAEQPVAAKPKIKVNINLNVQRFRRPVTIAAALLLIFLAIWYLRPSDEKSGLVAQKLEPNAQAAPQKELKDETIAPAENTAAPAQAETVAAEQPQPAEPEKAVAVANLDEKKLGNKNEDLLKTKTADLSAVGAAAQTPAAQKANEKAKKDMLAAKATPNAAKPAAANAKPPAAEERKQTPQSAIAANDQQSAKDKASTETIRTFSQSSVPVTARNEESAGNRESAGSDEKVPADQMDKAKYYFDKQKWGEALREYKGEINNSSKSKRHQASYMAAQCYLKMGNNKEAERLLKIIVDEGGSQKRHAKKLLESLEKKP